jgi:hypothetical protein
MPRSWSWRRSCAPVMERAAASTWWASAVSSGLFCRGGPSRSCPRPAVRHPAEPVPPILTDQQRRWKRAGRRFGHDQDRAVRTPRAGTRQRAGREPPQPSPAPGSEHEQVGAPCEAGEFHRCPPAGDPLLYGQAAGHPPDGLVDGPPDQLVPARRTVGVRVPVYAGARLAVVCRSRDERRAEHVDQQEACPAPAGFPDRPGQRPPTRLRAADAHDQARDLAGSAVHCAAPSRARRASFAIPVMSHVRLPGPRWARAVVPHCGGPFGQCRMPCQGQRRVVGKRAFHRCGPLGRSSCTNRFSPAAVARSGGRPAGARPGIRTRGALPPAVKAGHAWAQLSASCPRHWPEPDIRRRAWPGAGCGRGAGTI